MSIFNSWRVIVLTRNLSDGETEFTNRYESEKEAMDNFYKSCSSYGVNPATKACEIVVLNPDGDLMRMEKIDNSKYIAE